MTDRRLIEEIFPLAEISSESVHEKNLRKGHIKSAHVWWSVKPLVACRAVILSSLVQYRKQESKNVLDLILNFCQWRESNNAELVKKARKLIEKDNAKPPRLLDCFAGGGSVPLEGLRLGCETHALELNPVAILTELSTLVYPQRFAHKVSSKQVDLAGSQKQISENRLRRDLERWGNWVNEEAKKEIGQYYQTRPGEEVISYIWCRTVKCPNPNCGSEIPLIHKLELVNKPGQRAALKLIPRKDRKLVEIKLVENEAIDFDAENGTMKYGSVECPVCTQGFKSALIAKKLRKDAESRRMVHRLLAVVVNKKGVQGKCYRNPTDQDKECFQNSSVALRQMEAEHGGSLSVVPNEPIARPGGPDSESFFVHLFSVYYGLTRWGDLFNARQALALATFSRLVNKCYAKILTETQDTDYSKALTTYLALTLDSMAHYLSTSSTWIFDHMISAFIQGQAIAYRWSYAEGNPFSDQVGTWSYALQQILDVLDNLDGLPLSPATVQQGTATRLPYPDSFFDLIVTDPAYYDQVPYSDLSDFFYVWLKRSVGFLYPDLFRTPLTPKGPEIIQNSTLVRRMSSLDQQHLEMIKDKDFFENELTKALVQANRVLNPNGLLAIIFAHKTTSAWETLISALIKAGFTVTSSWPIHTERPSRLRAHESATLASSVWLICRKRHPEAGVGSWKTVQSELDARIKERLDFFLSKGIKGADALLSAIGPGLEVFGRYEKVEKVTGEPVKITDFLDKIREVVAYHALSTVLSEQELGNVDPATSFYVLWKWTFEPNIQKSNGSSGAGQKKNKKSGNGVKTLIPYDDTLKLAHSVRAEIDGLLKAHMLK